MRLALAVAALALSTQASAPHSAGTGRPASKPLPIYCQMGRCFVQTVEAMDPVLFGPGAVLFRVMSQNWQGSADAKGLKRAEDSSSYVLCSKKTPATAHRMSKKSYLVTFLAPDDGSTYYHSNESDLYLYFTVCHARAFGNALGDEGPAFAASLGYAVHPRADQPTVDSLERVMDFAR